MFSIPSQYETMIKYNCRSVFGAGWEISTPKVSFEAEKILEPALFLTLLMVSLRFYHLYSFYSKFQKTPLWTQSPILIHGDVGCISDSFAVTLSPVRCFTADYHEHVFTGTIRTWFSIWFLIKVTWIACIVMAVSLKKYFQQRNFYTFYQLIRTKKGNSILLYISVCCWDGEYLIHSLQ